MSEYTNGISLKAERQADTLLLNLKPSGEPTDADFEKLKPMLEAAVYSVHTPQVALLVDISELKGMSARSAWNELLHSVDLGSEFNRIAVYSENRWHNLMINSMSWMISPNLKVFKQKDRATEWILAA